FDEALPYCRRAVQLAPASAVAHYGFGVVLKQRGHLPDALGEFSEAARLDSDYAPPHFQAGQVLLKQHRTAEARSQFRDALRIQPANFQMLIYIARVLAADDDPAARDGAEAL